jgi:hypothetical protein
MFHISVEQVSSEKFVALMWCFSCLTKPEKFSDKTASFPFNSDSYHLCCIGR